MFVLTIKVCCDLPSVGNDCILSTQSTLSPGVGPRDLGSSPEEPPLARTVAFVELTLPLDVVVMSLCGVPPPRGWRSGWEEGYHLDTKYGMHRLTTKASASAADHSIAGA